MMIKNNKGEILKAGGIILDKNNQVLLLTNKERKNWSYPKGHLEPEELVEEAAKREVFEETGHMTEILKKLSDITYTNKETSEPIRIQMFLMRSIIKINDGELDTVKEWVSIKEAAKILPPNLSSLLKEI